MMLGMLSLLKTQCDAHAAVQSGVPFLTLSVWVILSPSELVGLIEDLERDLERDKHNNITGKCCFHITAQHSTAQHSTAQHSTAQHSTAQHSTAQRSAAHTLLRLPRGNMTLDN